MRRPTIQLFIVLISIVAILGILTSAQLFATADGPLSIYLPSIFKQADGSTSDQTGGDDTSTGDDVPAYSGADFEIEGDLELDGTWPPAIDWESTGEVPDADVLHVEDPHSKIETDPTIFKPDGKFDQPEGWIIQDGKVGPGQNELTNVMAWLMPRQSEEGDDWLVMGMERTKSEGTFFLDFEYNQSVWDPTKGGPERKVNDVVVGFELKGNPTDREKDLSVLIVQYLDTPPDSCEVTPGPGNAPAAVTVGNKPCPPYGDSGFYYLFLADGAIMADSGLGRATMNDEGLTVPSGWNSYDSQGNPRPEIPAFQFAEAAINLTRLNIELDCGAFSSMHAKDRSSLEPNSDLKDLAGPIETPLNCLINGHKFLDLDADGVWAGDPPEDGLEGWDIHIENTDPNVDWSDDTKTDADGFYEFDALVSGTYEVSESCPANENWLQTSPGLTDFDGCGNETYTLTIDRENREETGKDFGNIDPSLAVQKQCNREVWKGDQMPYTVTVTNTGSPILTDISVDDTLLGPLGIIDVLEPGASEILTATLLAETVGRIVNTATATTEFASEIVTATASCATDIVEPLVTKDAIGSFKLEYDWRIEKDVDEKDVIVLTPRQVVTPTYTLTVTADPEMKDYQISGTITISNPASIDAHFASVTDELSNGTAATVTCPGSEPYTVPAMGSLTCTYVSDEFQKLTDTDTNIAMANLINDDGGTTAITATAKIGPRDIEYRQAGPAENQKAVVTDSGEQRRVDPPPQLPTTLDASDASETPWIFTYSREFGPLPLCDQLVEEVNTATVKPVDGAPEDEAMARVTLRLYVVCAVTLGFEDQPAESTDWDYNDFVVRTAFDPTFSSPGRLSKIVFTMDHRAGRPDYTAANHEYHLRPDQFEGCTGSYILKNDGNQVDGGMYANEKDFLIFDDKKPLPDLVELTINFDAPGCPFEIDDSDLVGNFHCDECFFNPWMKSTNPGKFPDQTVPIGDSRMLSIPITNWQWPPNKVHIWDFYSDCVKEVRLENPPRSEPRFGNLWWLGSPMCTPPPT